MVTRLARLFALICLIGLAGGVVNSPRAQETAKPPSLEPPAQPSEELRAIRQLSIQIDDLSNELSQMRAEWKTLIDMEALTRAEHRAEDLRGQLLGVQTKEIDLRARIEDLDFQMRPETLQRALLFVGGVRMDEWREDLRKRIESEKRQASQQLELLAATRERIEADIRSADAEVIRLRLRVN
jgi:predicted  nucleic acid-binding Zn-ribbon protein